MRVRQSIRSFVELFIVCILSCVLIVLTACSTQTPDERLKTELRTVASWAATVRKVGEDWQGGRVQTGYTMKALEAAQEELQQEGKTIAQDSALPAAARTSATQQIEKLRDAVAQMHAAVARADTLAFAQALNELDAAARPVRAFVNQ
jgi:hypothetical protein